MIVCLATENREEAMCTNIPVCLCPHAHICTNMYVHYKSVWGEKWAGGGEEERMSMAEVALPSQDKPRGAGN